MFRLELDSSTQTLNFITEYIARRQQQTLAHMLTSTLASQTPINVLVNQKARTFTGQRSFWRIPQAMNHCKNQKEIENWKRKSSKPYRNQPWNGTRIHRTKERSNTYLLKSPEISFHSRCTSETLAPALHWRRKQAG